ncbi:MAG: class F sortase [Acidimicrobiales bacterium]
MRRHLLVIAAVVAVIVIAGVVVTFSWPSHANVDTNYTPMASGKIATAKTNMDSAVVASMKLSLESPAVNVPIDVVIPVIGVKSSLQAVGMTKSHAMAAPEGGAGSSDWSNTFWYRGSAIPGAVGTATIAGHIDDRFGDYAVFGRLSSLVRGNRIYIRNTKSGVSEEFVVTTTHAYTLAQAATRPVLDLIYGTGPPVGQPAQRSTDGLAHLSLVTCAGSWIPSLDTHNERLVVSAVRIH